MFNAEQDHALDLLEAGQSIFLTGGAGTGKTTVIKEFMRRHPLRAIASLGTTGASAQLIGGQTMHSFFSFGGQIRAPHSLDIGEGVKARLRQTRCIIIEEFSMARIDHMQVIRDCLYGAARGFGAFAGYQLVVVGDFAQLPPVATPDEMQTLSRLYGEDRLYAFQSRYWRDLKHVELTRVQRQDEHGDFARWLNAMRNGDKPDLGFINAQVGRPTEGAAILVATNAQADRINGQAMANLPGGHYRIPGKITGLFPERAARVPLDFCLKPGARVIICANGLKAGYANGSSGTLVRCERDSKAAPVAIVRLDSGSEVAVVQHVWENARYEASPDGKLERRVEGTFRQLPLLPGWAITIHRSQGMSIDRLHVDLRGAFAPGQAYVALSRATALGGLSLASPLKPEQIMYDERVTAFMARAKAEVAA